MSEYNFKETESIAEIFLKGYNSINNTEFKWDAKKSYQASEPYDFTAFYGKEKLGVQITRAVGDANKEFIRCLKANKIIEELEKQLEKEGVMPISIYLNFSKLPNKVDFKKVVYWLSFIIKQKVSDDPKLTYFSYNRDFDDKYLKNILEFVSCISISPINDRKDKSIFAYGFSDSPKLPDTQTRVISVIEKKAKKYSDVILCVDSGAYPIDNIRISAIKASLVEIDVEEVWIINDFLGNKNAIKVK